MSPSPDKHDAIDDAFEILKKWYAQKKQPLPKNEAFDFTEIKKGLWQIKAKKISNDAKTKEMLTYLQKQKEKKLPVAGFLLSSLAKPNVTPPATPQAISVSPALIQLKQMLIDTLPSGPNVVEKSLEGNHVRVHFPSGKLESTYRHAALKDTLAQLKMEFTEEKTHGSIPVIILSEKSVKAISDWPSFGKTFKEAFSHFIDQDMSAGINQFQVSESHKIHQSQQKPPNDVLAAAVSKIKEYEKKTNSSGPAIQHVLTGIEKLKSKKLREIDNRVALDKLLTSAEHNVQDADVLKLMHKVQEELHIKGAAKSESSNKKSNRR